MRPTKILCFFMFVLLACVALCDVATQPTTQKARPAAGIVRLELAVCLDAQELTCFWKMTNVSNKQIEMPPVGIGYNEIWFKQSPKHPCLSWTAQQYSDRIIILPGKNHIFQYDELSEFVKIFAMPGINEMFWASPTELTSENCPKYDESNTIYILRETKNEVLKTYWRESVENGQPVQKNAVDLKIAIFIDDKPLTFAFVLENNTKDAVKASEIMSGGNSLYLTAPSGKKYELSAKKEGDKKDGEKAADEKARIEVAPGQTKIWKIKRDEIILASKAGGVELKEPGIWRLDWKFDKYEAPSLPLYKDAPASQPTTQP